MPGTDLPNELDQRIKDILSDLVHPKGEIKARAWLRPGMEPYAEVALVGTVGGAFQTIVEAKKRLESIEKDFGRIYVFAEKYEEEQ